MCLRDLNGVCIGIVPKNSNGLYKVTHEEDEGHIAQEVLTVPLSNGPYFLRSHMKTH